MSDSPVTRGKFLRSFGTSLPGMVLGTGIATAAQTLVHRISSVTEPPPATPTAEKVPPTQEIIESGSKDGNRVALTFDDGPTPGITDRILDELKARDIRASFFMIGQRVMAAPDLARRVLAEGHEICNHTFTHPKLNTLPELKVAAEITKTQEVFQEMLGHRAIWFRAPYGALRADQAGIPQGLGLRIIGGNVHTRDWAQPGEDKILAALAVQTQAGSIIICHDLYAQTANCIGEALDHLKEVGFHPVTLSGLLDTPTNPR